MTKANFYVLKLTKLDASTFIVLCMIKLYNTLERTKQNPFNYFKLCFVLKNNLRSCVNYNLVFYIIFYQEIVVFFNNSLLICFRRELFEISPIRFCGCLKEKRRRIIQSYAFISSYLIHIESRKYLILSHLYLQFDRVKITIYF